jgi:hypothetical protein
VYHVWDTTLFEKCISYGFNLFKQTDYISVIYFTVNNVHVCIYAPVKTGSIHDMKFSMTRQGKGGLLMQVTA